MNGGEEGEGGGCREIVLTACDLAPLPNPRGISECLIALNQARYLHLVCRIVET